MLARGGNRDAFLQTRARWEAAGEGSPDREASGRHPAGTSTLPSRGRRSRLRRSDSRDSLDDGRPSRDSPPPPPPSRDTVTKSKHKSAERRRKSSAAGEERPSVVPLLPFSDGTELGDAGVAPAPSEPPRKSSRSGRRGSAAAGTVTDTPDKRPPIAAADKPPPAESEGPGEEAAGRRRLSRTPSLGARDRPSLWSVTEHEKQPEQTAGLQDGDDEGSGYQPSQRAALGIGSDWGGSLNRRRMPRGDAAPATISKASGFKLPAVISGRLARQSESFVSSSPDLSRELFAPAEGRSPRVGRRDLDEILERAARRRSSRQAAGSTPRLTARALFVAEPRGAHSGRAESVDRWERGSEGRSELPDSPGGRAWLRVRRDSDTSDTSSAAGRSSSSGVPEEDRRPERPPASPLVAGSGAAPRRTGFFRPRAGSEGGILDELDTDSPSAGGGGGGWRSATRSWLALDSRSTEAAVDDAVETSSVSSSGTDKKTATRTWLAQGRLDADDASETASICSSSGGGKRNWLSRGSVSAEPAEESAGGAGRPPAAPPVTERQEPALASVTRPQRDALVNGVVGDRERASQSRPSAVGADIEGDGKAVENFSSPGDSSTLLRKKLAALRAGGASEREADKTQDDFRSDDRVSQLRLKASAALALETDSLSDSQAPKDDAGENRATLLRKKIAAIKKPVADEDCDDVTAPKDAAEEDRAAALRQKMAGLRPDSLTLPTDGRSSEAGQARSPLTPRLSPSEDTPGGISGVTPAEETSRSRPTGRSKPAVPKKPTADSGLPPTDRSPATPRGPRPRSAVRRTSSLTGRDSSLGRSRSRSPVKGRIATLRLKPRRVSQSPDPLGRWRSVEDVLSSPAGPVDVVDDDVSWEPQSGAVEPPPSPPGRDAAAGTPPSTAAASPPLPPARPPRRRRSRPSESPTKERVDENRNQISVESSESREEESSSSPSSSPTPGHPATEAEVQAAGDAWLATLVPAGRQRSPSGSSCGSLGSFDLEQELFSAEEPTLAGPRQLISVKSDLIAFSPGKEPAEPTPSPPPAAAAAAADVSSAPSPAAAAAPVAAAADSNISQLLKKQELYFQDQLIKRDREMTAMKNANSKLIQQASNNKTEKLLERTTHLIALLTNENGLLRRELKTSLSRLTAERDDARQEVANAEAMFADLHRKYEKSKMVLQDHRRSAERNDSTCKEAQEQAVRERQRYEMLRQHSEDAHTRLQTDLEAAEKAHQTELLTVKAKLQLAENRGAKLERENREITAICDELIQKMGGAR